MNWELYWTAVAVIVTYKVITSIVGWVQYQQLKKDYGSIDTILERIEKDNY